MLDFTKLFNIVFVAVAAALIVFFLVTTIVVAAKGKRRCNAFDVIVRILATLVFIGAAACFACAVLTMLSGDFCIVAADVDGVAAAAFVMSGSITELPMAELFVALSTTIGSNLAAVLFICSLAALIVDCVTANKKPEKAVKSEKAKKSAKQNKSPEQLKREAELERIRRIGEVAVKKADAAAKSDSKTTATPPADEPAQQESDWRKEQPAATAKTEPSGFVGIKETDDSFDSFDSFDTFDSAEDNVDSAERVDDSVEDTFDIEESLDDGAEVAEPADEEFGGVEPELDEQFTYEEDIADEQPAEQEEQVEQAEEPVSDGEPQAEQEGQEDEAWYNQGNDDTSVFDDYSDSGEDLSDDDQIEPNRDIYIPEIRTIVRRDRTAPQPRSNVRSKPEAAQAEPRTRKPAEKTVAAKKPSASRSKATESKPIAARKSVPAKKQPVKKPEPVKPTASTEKKLPVPRRYVILDRRNAVNMFGEYLKERNQAEKDKLKSSINTIIIE